MTTQNIDEKQGLDIIRNMIESSRKNYSESAWYFLIWGWVIMVAALLHYALINWQWAISPGIIWSVAPAIGVIYTVIRAIKEGRSTANKTFVDHCLSGLWIGSFGMFVVTILIGIQFSWVLAFPIFMAVYGWGTLTSGVILKFRPLIVGGIISFLVAAGSVFVQSEKILLLLAFSLLCSYLIPGYMLKNRKA